MKREIILTSFLCIVLQIFAQTTPIIYQDCSKNGMTIDYRKKGTASVNSSSGRTSCEYVQLWAGGPLWATFNVGATITNYANLTAGTDPTSGNVAYYNTANVGGLYAWNNSNLNGRMTTWTSSVTTGISDIATTLWGSNWTTPTREQLETLCNMYDKYGTTTWTWCDGSTTQYVAGCTLKGYKVSGVGDYAKYSIFLPVVGYFETTYGLVYLNTSNYWSSTTRGGNEAYQLDIFSWESASRDFTSNTKRNGKSVRAVLANSASTIVTLTLKAKDCSSNNVITCIKGHQLSIAATPNTGYHFVKWNDGNTSNPRTITVNANVTYTAEFAPDTCKITTSATNGTVSGAGTYTYNTSVTLTATPNEHYHFVKWSDGNTSNPRTITVTKDSTFTAVFALDQFTITATSEHGTVTGTGTYNYGATATLTATNSDCYSFQKWSDGNTDNPRSVVVTQDSTFTAIFVGTGYQETVKCTVVNESPYGTVSFAGTVIKDSNISLNATAPECSQFVKWSDNDTSNPRNLTITQDSTLTAIFEKIQFNVSINTSDSIKGKVKMEESLP